MLESLAGKESSDSNKRENPPSHKNASAGEGDSKGSAPLQGHGVERNSFI